MGGDQEGDPREATTKWPAFAGAPALALAKQLNPRLPPLCLGTGGQCPRRIGVLWHEVMSVTATSTGREVLWRRPWDEETPGFVVGTSGPNTQYASLSPVAWLSGCTYRGIKNLFYRGQLCDSSDLDWVFTLMRDSLPLSSCSLSRQSMAWLRPAC